MPFTKGHKIRPTGRTFFKKGHSVRPPVKPKVKKTCFICGKEYFVIKSRELKTKCCSKKCLYKYHDPKKFITKAHYKKIGLKQRGKRHWNWQGGLTPLATERTNKASWRKLRVEVYKRDGYKCRVCGVSGKRLNAHHIIPWSKVREDKIENLLTVCCVCHAKLERGIIIWQILMSR